MTPVDAREAKARLLELLERAERGEVITITRNGREVARLVPARPRASAAIEVVAELRAARIGVRRGRLSVRKMVEEGRRSGLRRG
jgi:prevent-host-death family protein